ncbi:putative receptor-like protein kinase [Carex littledalei]|uniref:Putative receptor-like protein kinase n=1 Tax=Carex littledalei TaxID=544730 RepID=A0A833QEW0_9POAL|nr:putative receptor-like protein kinase [Carex littledalei]
MATSRNPSPLPCAFLLISLLFSSSSALFSPSDNHLIACGSSSAATLEDHRVFQPDSTCGYSHLHSYGPKVSLSSVVDSSLLPSPLHGKARVFSRSASYEFHIKEKGAHLIRLHFYPFTSSEYELSSALFHVSAGEFSLLTNFSTSVPVLKEFIVQVDTDSISINFIPAEDNLFAFVNAIEVISAPRDLILDICSLVKPDRVEKFEGLSKQSFETLYRLNIGGLKVTPFNDSLWRTWLPENEVSVKFDAAESKIESFSGRINYLKYGASREVAPDNVYQTARVIGDSSHNMTWEFSLRPENRYLVRMHFCDVVSMALNEMYFNIYVNGYLVNKDLDLSHVTGQLASPYYIDFVIDTDNSGLLKITIGSSNISKTNWVHGLLNGLEIFKMNNTDAGLDGEIPISMLPEGIVRRGIGEFMMSLPCGFGFAILLVALFVLVMKWRTESRNSLAMSHLPSVALEGKSAKGGYQMVSKVEI